MRVRDAVAAVVALLAVRLASDVGDPSTPRVRATFEFYTEYASHYHSFAASKKEVDLARPIAVDFDGDGVAESLVVPLAPSTYRDGNATVTAGGGLRVLDLSPLRARAVADAEPSFPLYPRVSALYLAETAASISASSVAVRIAAGYVARDRDEGGDNLDSPRGHVHVAALWNDGSVTFHSGPGLDLVWRSTAALWSPTALASSSSGWDLMEFEEAAVVLTPSLGANGAVIVGGRVLFVPSNSSEEEERRDQPPQLAYYALDARNGDLLWKHDDSTTGQELVEMDAEAHLHSGDHISEPLRSRGLSNQSSSVQLAAEDCFKSFRTSTLDPSNAIFPHFWNQRDGTSFSLAHFERNKRGAAVPPSKRCGSHKNQHFHRHDDKANVLVSHGRAGIEVLSLPDGRPVCHLSLREGLFYDDINHDGTLDHVQFLSGDLDGGRPFVHGEDDPARIHDLFRPVPSEEKAEEGRGDPDKTDESLGPAGPANFRLPPCYAVALSGLSAREQLFNAPLCHDRGDRRDGPSSSTTWLDPFDDRAVSDEERRSMHRGRVRAAPPLPVEGRRRPPPPSSGGAEGGVGPDAPAADLVFAVNAGVVTRYDSHGRMIWQAASRGMPRWGGGPGERAALSGRIDYARRSRRRGGYRDRPILISGEREFVILSSSRGKRLASVTFPQSAVAPPLLVDVNGDGTTDVLVISTDAIWGYTVRVTSGSSAVFVMMCLFIMSILVVWTIHEVGRTRGSDRRSTDM